LTFINPPVLLPTRPPVSATVYLVLGAAIGCSAPDRSADAPVHAHRAIPTVAEAWVSPLDTVDNVDSPAIWFSPDGPRVIATAKETHKLIVYDAATGAALRRIGGPGTGPGQLNRPNGVLVLGDTLALVVERDNRRVQVFALPSFRSLGSFGAPELVNPYGLDAYQPDPGRFRVYVTDNYEAPDESVPPLAELGRRVKWYDVSVSAGSLRATFGGAFGDTTSAGAIRIIESIAVDPVLQRLVIAEEDESDTHIKEYTLDGKFTGRTFGRGIFTEQAEGIALWACPDSTGYWVTTDQGEPHNAFHLFDRISLEHRGSFRGAVTHTTDGVALSQRALGPFENGAFVAAHADAGVVAFDWAAIAAATGANVACQPSGVF